jgi:hypothetical protein
LERAGCQVWIDELSGEYLAASRAGSRGLKCAFGAVAARAGWLAAVEHEIEAVGNVDLTFYREARAGFGEVANQAADHCAISAESDARDFVGFSARGVSPVGHGSDLLIAPLQRKRFLASSTIHKTPTPAAPKPSARSSAVDIW